MCVKKKNSGNCTDYKPYWYFEYRTKTCRRFLYGGCNGNGNRFNTHQECRDTCLYGVRPRTDPVVPVTRETPRVTRETRRPRTRRPEVTTTMPVTTTTTTPLDSYTTSSDERPGKYSRLYQAHTEAHTTYILVLLYVPPTLCHALSLQICIVIRI